MQEPAIYRHRGDIVFFFALAVLLYVAYRVRGVLLITYVSLIFAIVLGPAIQRIMSVRIGGWQPGRAAAVLILLVGLAAVLALFFTFAIPPIFRDLKALAAEWPHKVQALTDKIRSLPFMGGFDAAQLRSYAGNALGGALGFAAGFAGGILSFFSGLILMVYFILDGERAFRWFLSMVPAQHRTRLEFTMRRSDLRVRNWLVGQAALMVILGVLSAIVYGLLGLKYFYALAVITGLANIVPIIGPIISVSIAAVVALVDSPIKMLGVFAFYFAYQQLENAYLSPRIMRASVDLPALAVVFALALGGELAGILGALMAVPTAAIVAVFVEEYLVRDKPPQLPTPTA